MSGPPELGFLFVWMGSLLLTSPSLRSGRRPMAEFSQVINMSTYIHMPYDVWRIRRIYS